ncbi:MAG: hypothetical protein J6Z47_08360 [Bacteroidales bacterium]|nr:hypothetical protein [Bacteroidales bacterium]
MKNFTRCLYGTILLLAVVSCERLNPDVYFKETSTGRNVLSFTLNKEKVYQQISGGIPSSYPLQRHATYKEEGGNIIISAQLHHKCFSYISFTVPAEKVTEGADLKPSVEFEYLYLPQIAHWGEPESGPGYTGTPLIIDRKAQYRKVTVKSSSLSIRKWAEDEKILSGNFEMTGQYADSTGKVHKFQVSDGMFDVTDQPYPRGN